MDPETRLRAALLIRERIEGAADWRWMDLMDDLALLLDRGRTDEGLEMAERLARATYIGDSTMSGEELQVQVIEKDGCPEVRIRLSPEPPPDNEPAAVQVRRGGDGLALRFRDAQAFEAFRAGVAA